MNTPTLINLPPPPSDTPTDQGPGTPNSGTTSLSALSVVAVKDGHQGHTLSHGHGHGHHNPRDSVSSTTTLDAERADRISRLAGLERVSTVRQSGQGHLAPGAGSANPPPGYFDNASPHIKERSTVGSASATGSVGGRTTWASVSVGDDTDKMSEDQDDGASSAGGLSDEGNASLVGFGEGASSTVSGPISTATVRAMAARQNSMGSPSMSKATTATPQPPPPNRSSSPMSGIVPSGATDPRFLDGMSYDPNVVDTTMRPAPPVAPSPQFGGAGTEFAERVLRDRLADGEGRPMGSPDERNQSLGKFSFERE
jgi:hypothetical protein